MRMGAILRDARTSDLESINSILETNGQIADVEEVEIKDVIVAEVDGKVVGCGMCREEGNAFEISKISVLPANQGKGIGMEMVMTLLGRTSGAKCWLLSVNSHDFWELFDFKKVSEEEEPTKFREQCAGCTKKTTCDRVVMFREAE
jgi:N-acetylglutamate synthase-like GNAT family acetyltransferase